MGSDSKERDAIEKVAKRVKEQGERDGKPVSYEKAQAIARKAALDADRQKGK